MSQYDAVPVGERELEAWKIIADEYEDRIPLGHVNWPMIVRSLIQEVRKVGGQFDDLAKVAEQALTMVSERNRIISRLDTKT